MSRLLLVLLLNLGSAPPATAAREAPAGVVARIIGPGPDRGHPTLLVRFRFGGSSNNDGARLELGSDVARVVQARFGSSSGRVFDALVPALGKAMTKRKLRLAAGQIIDALASAEVVRFYEIQEGVVLEAASEARVARIAERFFRATGKTLLVTSARRDAAGQAEAMYDKIRYGGSLSIYRDRAAINAIRGAAKAGRKAGRDRTQIIAAIAQVIRDQMGRGVYISKHLLSGAVDIRSTGMSGAARRAFKRAALAEAGVTVLYERRPPHFHLSL